MNLKSTFSLIDLSQETPYRLLPGKLAPVVYLGLDKLKPVQETGWHDFLPSSPLEELQVSHGLYLTIFLNQQQTCSELPQKGAAGQDAVSSLSPATPPVGKTSTSNWQSLPAEPGFEAGVSSQQVLGWKALTSTVALGEGWWQRDWGWDTSWGHGNVLYLDGGGYTPKCIYTR